MKTYGEIQASLEKVRCEQEQMFAKQFDQNSDKWEEIIATSLLEGLPRCRIGIHPQSLKPFVNYTKSRLESLGYRVHVNEDDNGWMQIFINLN